MHQEIEGSERARYLQQIIWFTYNQQFKYIVSGNKLTNFTINAENITGTRAAYGPSIPILKGLFSINHSWLKTYFMHQEIEGPERARYLQQIIWFTYNQQFKYIGSGNKLTNFTINAENITGTRAVYGPSIPILKEIHHANDPNTSKIRSKSQQKNQY